MARSYTLPDHSVGYAPEGLSVPLTGGTTAGFKTVALSSKQDRQTFRTNSGRLITNYNSAHIWKATISYNEITKEQFDIIYTFLLRMQTERTAFYVKMPHWNQETEIANIATTEDILPGSGQFFYGSTVTSNPGQYFNVEDPKNPQHVKTYMYTGREGGGDILTTPSMQYFVNTGAVLNFTDVKLRVVLEKQATISYTVNQDNLYKLSLKVEEALI